MHSKRDRIILVDDNLANLDQGRNMLKSFYQVYPTASAQGMFEILENMIPDLILLDIEMPEMDGYEAIRRLKADARFTEIPVVFLTMKSDESSEQEGFDLGAVDYVTKPFSAPLLIKRIATHLAMVRKSKQLMEYADRLEEKVQDKTKDITNLQNAVLATVADLVEFRDSATGGHIIRTRLFLETLVESLANDSEYKDQLATWELEVFFSSSQLHDVGKIAICDSILNKPGKLSVEEFEIMKTHVTVGVDAIQRIRKNTNKHAFLDHALLITGTHHEKWNGSGYPAGLKGCAIPLEGRLMALVDVYDALVSERPYKKAFTHERACQIILEDTGMHFDPVLTKCFMNVHEKIERIAKENVPKKPLDSIAAAPGCSRSGRSA